MLDFRDRKIEESSDDSDDDDEGDVPTSPTTIRTKHDLMMKTEVCALLLLICSEWAVKPLYIRGFPQVLKNENSGL